MVAGYRESGLTQRAYAKQAGVSLASIARWVQGKSQGVAAPGGFAAVQLRAEPAAESAVIKIRSPEGIEVELPRGLGELTLRRCLREVLLSCSR